MRSFALALALAASGCAQTAPTSEIPAEAQALPGAPPTAGPVMAGPMRADPVYDAATLVAAMHDRYADDWYRTLSFTQATFRKTPDGGVVEETWREWAAFPGRLRIEMDDPMAGTDALFVGDTTFIYTDGALATARADRNPLLLWGFDVYAQDPAATLEILETEGLDLDAFRVDAWDGRRHYVLGSPEAGEVWIDRETLLFSRLVEPGPGGALQDVRFLEYEPLGDAWIAPRVEVYVGDDLVFWEVYRDVEANPVLPDVLFDPRRWAEGVAASE